MFFFSLSLFLRSNEIEYGEEEIYSSFFLQNKSATRRSSKNKFCNQREIDEDRKRNTFNNNINNNDRNSTLSWSLKRWRSNVCQIVIWSNSVWQNLSLTTVIYYEMLDIETTSMSNTFHHKRRQFEVLRLIWRIPAGKKIMSDMHVIRAKIESSSRINSRVSFFDLIAVDVWIGFYRFDCINKYMSKVGGRGKK